LYLFKEIRLAEKKIHRNEDYNENWEAEIAAYDEECQIREKEFIKKHIMFDETGSVDLTDEENNLLSLYLDGTPYDEIAKNCEIDEEEVDAYMEIIRLKLSQSEEES
jgi:hypothetical protein